MIRNDYIMKMISQLVKALAIIFKLKDTGRLDDAEGQFRRALARAPNNGWSHYGLAELYRTRGDAEAARKAQAELAKTWVGDRQLLELSKL